MDTIVHKLTAPAPPQVSSSLTVSWMELEFWVFVLLEGRNQKPKTKSNYMRWLGAGINLRDRWEGNTIGTPTPHSYLTVRVLAWALKLFLAWYLIRVIQIFQFQSFTIEYDYHLLILLLKSLRVSLSCF